MDWPQASCTDSFVFTNNYYNTVVNAWNCKSMDYLSKIADLLGKTSDRDAYDTRIAGAKNAINKYLYDPVKGAYRDGMLNTANLTSGTGKVNHYSIHSSFWPLAFGITPDSNKAAVTNYLKSRGMACSPYGGRFLLEGLYLGGDENTPLQLMTAKTMNSWYHMEFVLGATCVAEAWDPSEKSNMSFAHPWASAPTNLIPRYLMGITALLPGYKKIAIKPQPGTLANATITVPTIRGPVTVSITNAAKYVLKISIPVTATAQVYFPLKGAVNTMVYVDGVQMKGALSGNYVMFDSIGSGSHVFSTQSTGTSVLEPKYYGSNGEYSSAQNAQYIQQQSMAIKSIQSSATLSTISPNAVTFAQNSAIPSANNAIDLSGNFAENGRALSAQTPAKAIQPIHEGNFANSIGIASLQSAKPDSTSAQNPKETIIAGKALLQGRKNHYGTRISLVSDSVQSPIAAAFTFANGEFKISCPYFGKYFLVYEVMGAYSAEYSTRRIPVNITGSDSVIVNTVELMHVPHTNEVSFNPKKQ